MPSGLLILDNNAFGQLTSDRALERFVANLRASDLVAQPTELNLLEITAASDAVRGRLLHALKRAAPNTALLPWPIKLLKAIGLAIVAGDARYVAQASGMEWYLEEPEALAELSVTVREFNEKLEAAFDDLHETNRRKLQPQLKRAGIRDEFGSARAFLEHAWVGSEQRRVYAEVTWDALGLPRPVPVEALERTEAWRILLDVEGVAVYERAVAHAQPRRVHRMDFLQLVYLAGAERRLIATSDAGLLRAAAAVLPGRYPNARAVHMATLLA